MRDQVTNVGSGQRQSRRLLATIAILSALLSGSVVAQNAFDPSQIIFSYRGNYADYYGVGGSVTLLGDINGDGIDDIASSCADPYGTIVFFGGDPPDTIVDHFITGARVSPVDLDGDGVDDVVSASRYSVDHHPFGVVYFTKGYGDSLASVPYDSLRYDTGNYYFGEGIRTGYVDDDSLGDLLVHQPNTYGGPSFHYFSGCPALDTVADWSWKVENYSHYTRGFGFIDFNGDSCLDIFVGLRWRTDPGSISAVYVFLGPDFSDEPDYIIGYPVEISGAISEEDWLFWSVGGIGDVNGDGWPDLGVPEIVCPIYYCGPGLDTIPDLITLGAARSMAAAGDVNGDGFNDLLCGDTRYEHGAVDLYVGGPEFDSQWDLTINRSDLPPHTLTAIGRTLGSAGDFNNDGYNDYMFGCGNFSQEQFGEVLVISGGPWIQTGIEEPPSAEVLPDDPVRLQAHPNPFNTTTTIQFDLPRRSQVSAVVFSILGTRVRTLTTGSLSAGPHRLTWGGLTDSGEPVASGVYLLQVTSEDLSATCKLMLQK